MRFVYGRVCRAARERTQGPVTVYLILLHRTGYCDYEKRSEKTFRACTQRTGRRDKKRVFQTTVTYSFGKKLNFTRACWSVVRINSVWRKIFNCFQWQSSR